MNEMHELGAVGGMYLDNILEHFHAPHNFGPAPDGAQVRHEETSWSCGDNLGIALRLDDAGRVAEVKFSGKGCAISMAATSMLTDRVKGMTLADVAALGEADVFGLLGFEPGLSRLNCALLGLKTLRTGINEYLNKQDGKQAGN